MTANGLYHPREIAGLVGKALRSLPVVVITGMRQTGKTTFLQQDPLFSGRRFLSLDDFATLEAARNDPEALVGGSEPVTIDEAQMSPALLTAVKQAVDRKRVPGRFVLSGSANFSLLRGVSESLAGRALYLNLLPFTRRERLGRLRNEPWLARLLEPRDGVDPLAAGPPDGVSPVRDDEILDGGMPPVALGEAASRELWFLGYEQTYLERDVRALSQVADLVTFRNLLHLAVLRNGQVLNQSELARDAKLPTTTVSRYLGLLEASFVLRRLAPHLKSRTTRLIKSPKLFVSDSGLAAYLASVTELAATSGEPQRGPLHETWVLQNLAGITSVRWPRAEITYWSVQGRHEVDFVVTLGRRSVAVEVKAGSRFGQRDLAGLRAFLAKSRDDSVGVLAYNGSEAVSLGEGLYAIPLCWLLA